MKLQANIENLKFDDKKYIKREFELGDIVLVRKSIRNKDDDRFEGPGKIIDKVHDRSYTIRFENGRTLVRNIEWLKPFKKRGCEICWVLYVFKQNNCHLTVNTIIRLDWRHNIY